MDSIVIFSAQYLYLVALAVAVIYFLTQPGAIRKSMAICAVIVAPLSYLISRIAALFYYDSRPFVVGHFAPLFAHAADNGFPSDHVLLIGAAATIVWFYNRKLSAVLWAFALLIGSARIYAGVHHAVDIAGSIAIVLISGVIYHLIMKRRKGRVT